MGALTIERVDTFDVRFPTSRLAAGSDAMNPDPDYSAAYCVLHTSEPGLEGHGLTFTIGRGNELCVAAIESLAPLIIGRSLEDITANMGKFWHSLVRDSQLRWVGPEKGVIHLACAALINALWDLWAKHEGKPVWALVADLEPEQVVALIDFTAIQDAITPAEALEMLRAARPGREARRTRLLSHGYPAYTTSAGWLGYPDDKIERLCSEAMAAGWTAIKLKVGRDLDDDRRRLALVRRIIGPDRRLMVDANQVWEVDEACRWMSALAEFDPYWIEEPVHPDDILGHATVARSVRPIRVATGEHCANRVMFKQLLQADGIDVVQVDACRLGGLNENLAVLLLANKFGKPVCPHAGGVGLCEYVQHISMIDYLVVSGELEGRMTEHAGILHDMFPEPIRIINGHYMPPQRPGFSVEFPPALLNRNGPEGRADVGDVLGVDVSGSAAVPRVATA